MTTTNTGASSTGTVTVTWYPPPGDEPPGAGVPAVLTPQPPVLPPALAALPEVTA